MEDYIKLKSLSIDELTGVVNLYPWFGNARKELCVRLAAMGDKDTAAAALAEASMYVSSRKALSGIDREKERQDCSDKDIDAVLKSYITGDPVRGEGKGGERRVFVAGGDYFSREQYEAVKSSDDGVFPAFSRTAASGGTGSRDVPEDDVPEFYTETLAGIYAEQGYPEQAKKIYSKLSLAYPEKNAYFAALIRNLEQEN